MTTYRSRAAEREGQPDEGSPLQPLLPCTRCQTPTAHSTLATLGARCFTCYLAFCRQQQPKVDVGDKRDNARSWAHALKAREDAGEKLSPAVRAMWRAALRQPAVIAGTPVDTDEGLNEANNRAARAVREYAGAQR